MPISYFYQTDQHAQVPEDTHAFPPHYTARKLRTCKGPTRDILADATLPSKQRCAIGVGIALRNKVRRNSEYPIHSVPGGIIQGQYL